MQNEKEFTQICKEILALSEKVKELNLSRLETISVEIKLAKNSFDDKSGEMDAKIVEFSKIAERLEPLKESIAKAEELIAKIKEGGAGGVSEEKAKQLINEAVSELASAVEELKQKTPIDDTAAAENKTFSSKKIEDTFIKKDEAPSGGVDETKVNELIAQKIVDLVSKTNLADAVNDKIDINTLNTALGTLASAVDGKISTVAAAAVTRSVLDRYVKAQNIASNTIDFMQGVNFTGSISGQVVAGARESGQSGLVYINGNGVTGFSSDFVILNPSEATYGQGYVFFSYFVRPTDNKILISFIKAA